MINVLIADDHPAVRYGISSILELEPSICIYDQAETGDEVLNKVSTEPIDLVLMDINMSGMDGITTTQKLKKRFPTVKVLGFSIYDDEYRVVQMLKAGADGYLLKAADKNEITKAVIETMKGGKYITPEIAHKVLYNSFAGGRNEKDKANKDDILSKREIEILRLIAEDNSYNSIAKKLDISKRTVDTHRYNISKKLGIKSVAGLIRYTLQNNF